MINRIFGWLFALVTLAVVVFAVLNMGNYTSMCFDDAEEVVEAEVIVVDINENEESVDALPIVDSVSVAMPEVDAAVIE